MDQPYGIQDSWEATIEISTSEAQRDLFGLIERVNRDCTEAETTPEHGSAVISKDGYDALVETSYLLRSPRNGKRLLSARETQSLTPRTGGHRARAK